MAGRCIIALFTSPMYGLLAMLASLPVALLAMVVVFLVATGGFASAGGPDGGLLAILFSFLLGVVALLAAVAIYTQQIRYAASFSGAARLAQQPPFRSSFWRCFWLTIVLIILFSFLIFAGVMGVATFGTQLGLEAGWDDNLRASLERMAEAEEYPAQVLTSADAWLIEVLLIFNMVIYMLTAFILVPFVTGLGGAAGRAWSFGMILYRFLIALPCLAVVCRFIGVLLSALFMPILPDEAGPMMLAISLQIQVVLFSGAALAHEALLLRASASRPVSVDDAIRSYADTAFEPEDYRAIREKWGSQGPGVS